VRYVGPPNPNGGALPTDERLIYERALPALPVSVRRLRAELADALGGAEIGAERHADVTLVVSEAATNVVLHAYPPLRPGLLFVNAAVGGGDLRLRVCDCGCGMGAASAHPGLGVGLLLMTRFADDLEIAANPSTSGTSIHATFRGAGAANGAHAAARLPSTQEFNEYVGALAAELHARDAADLRARARRALHDAARLRAERR
jgi:anti-sigma regulatory factor (Ser/Thr protein kinase)